MVSTMQAIFFTAKMRHITNPHDPVEWEVLIIDFNEWRIHSLCQRAWLTSRMQFADRVGL